MLGDIKEPPNKKEYLNEPSKYANKWLDENLPHDKLTVMDIDAIVRTGFDGKTDHFGSFRMLEFKSGGSNTGEAGSINQNMNYAAIDAMLRAGDLQLNPTKPRYEGFYVIWSKYPTWYIWRADNEFSINGVKVTYGQLEDFFMHRLKIKPYKASTDQKENYEHRTKLQSG
jgi:hypothetical protein